MKGTFNSLHARTTPATWSVVVGNTTTSGFTFARVKPSHSYVAKSDGAVSTPAGPTTDVIRSMRTEWLMGAVYRPKRDPFAFGPA